MEQRFGGQAAIVTGAASGIGLATARRLARDGARVVMADLDADRLRDAAAMLGAEGLAHTLAQPCDVSDFGQIDAAVAAALERFGRLDIVVNCAAYMPHAALVDLTAEQWERTLRINLVAPFLFLRHALTRMAAGGAVVNVASVHAFRAQPNAAPYAASKAALLALTRAGAVEGAARGVRVNAVVPGAIDTPMLWSNPAVASGAERIDPHEIGRPEDVAAAIAWLASPEARFVQGEALAVDGGRLAKL